jgi:hypothetical protein
MENNDYKPIVKYDAIYNSIANYGSETGIGAQRIGQYVISELVHDDDFTCSELFYCDNSEFWTLAEKHLHLI